MLKRILVFSLAAVLVWSPGAQAVDLMGPPTAGLDCGKMGAGAAFFASEEDLELDLDVAELTLDDVETQRYYGWVSYGLTEWCEVYTRLGLMDGEIGDLDFQDSSSFIGSVGTKITFAREQWVDWGVGFQASWSELEDSYTLDLTEYGLGTYQEIDVEFLELQTTVGPVVKLDGWKIYGGPLFYYFDGEMDVRANGLSGDFDLEEESRIGGYGGVIVELGGSAALLAEAVFLSEGWGAGVNVGWEF